MANKRMTLKEGFWVDGRKIRNCHFSFIKGVDLFNKDSVDCLVVLEDGAVVIVSGYKQEVFSDYPEACELAAKRDKEHREFCQEQLEYYQDQLLEGETR